MKELLKEYIRFLLEKEILGEPDQSEEDEKEAEDEQAAVSGIAGATTPLGTGPTYPDDDKRKRKLTGPKKKKRK
tara:strand:- start:189 stop:410 length:222 start_codon:yes stop_codon:yes gene_type:complete